MTYTRNPNERTPLLWTEADLAAFLQKSPAAVKKQRQRGDAPPHVTIGRRIYYVPGRVAEWVRQQSVTTATPAR